jgi:hypothetical protein
LPPGKFASAGIGLLLRISLLVPEPLKRELKMKPYKTLATSLLILLGSQMAAPGANALVGLCSMFANPAVGALVAVSGLTSMAGGVLSSVDSHNRNDGSMLLFMLGIVLLNGKDASLVQLKALLPAEASALGLTESERVSFNESREEISAINQTVVHESMGSSGLDANRAHLAWDKYKAALDPQAYSGLNKLSLGLAKSQSLAK